MPVLKEEYIKTERINGVIYNMSPSRDCQRKYLFYNSKRDKRFYMLGVHGKS